MDYILRKESAITGEKNCEVLASYDFPLFCGCTNEKEEEDIIARCEFGIFESGSIELLKLIPLDLLYQNGHGAGAVGALWQKHHEEFANFLMSFKPKSVLEIGGGHGKLAKECLKLDEDLEYTIIEPNSSAKDERINYIDGFFEKKALEGKKFDLIAHSHTFEHIYEPNKFLNECAQMLGGGGEMVFSLPNMQKWLENKFVNCLCFEHTLFLSEKILEFLSAKNGFKILKKHYFGEHSIFYALKIDKNIKTDKVILENEFAKNKALFEDMMSFYKEKIDTLNKLLNESTKEIYLFGAHLFSQFLLYNGLCDTKIQGILDNDPNKIGKRLYGTQFKVFSPEILKDKSDVLLILNAGIYNDEIKKGILNLNEKIEIIT